MPKWSINLVRQIQHAYPPIISLESDIKAFLLRALILNIPDFKDNFEVLTPKPTPTASFSYLFFYFPFYIFDN